MVVGLVAVTVPTTIFVRRAFDNEDNIASAGSVPECREGLEGGQCDEETLSVPPPYPRYGQKRDKYQQSEATDDQFGVEWLATALCFAALITLCFLAATLTRRYFLRAWKRNDVELWCGSGQALCLWQLVMHLLCNKPFSARARHANKADTALWLLRQLHLVRSPRRTG